MSSPRLTRFIHQHSSKDGEGERLQRLCSLRCMTYGCDKLVDDKGLEFCGECQEERRERRNDEASDR